MGTAMIYDFRRMGRTLFEFCKIVNQPVSDPREWDELPDSIRAIWIKMAIAGEARAEANEPPPPL